MEEKKKIVSEIIDYVETNLSFPERLNVEEIARHAGYSRFHLNRVFSQTTGSTIHQYIKKQRLQQAAVKLLEGKESIAAISLEAAYQSQQAFSLAFKQEYGCTPMAYRNAGIHIEISKQNVVKMETGVWRCAA
ncbi:AraC family transcriptional regulator [Clostridium sp. E02]|uniref:helix-turn-helix domain-containing protein n=1 Tax=Clostridium sp. E02 TaxID=2487134 RepID=UPI000F51CD5E|nr:AraC family transcriptional regulator [Clostridium sp. E02]